MEESNYEIDLLRREQKGYHTIPASDRGTNCMFDQSGLIDIDTFL